MVAARRRGLTFDEFWQEAVRPQCSIVMVTTPDPPRGAVRWPTDRTDRLNWQAAINSSKAGWHRAYERRRPSEPEAALDILRPGLAALEEVAEARAEAELDDGPHAVAA